nr:reverse transcriptase domain-containing protein [Tanacetum cinerariifolium]
QQVQNSCQFNGLPGDDVNRHIDKFLEITQYIKQNGVSDDALRLSLFPYSLTHHAIAWYDRLPRNSIHTFEDMMRKFLSNYFPLSMVTKLRNEITDFRQKPNESLFKAWERYKLSIDRCPKHNMLLVTKIDMFYNGLTLRHQDTIKAAAGGTFMQKTPKECYDLIENMTAHHNHWDTFATRDDTSRTISSTTTNESPKVVQQLEMMNKNFQEMMKQMQPMQMQQTSSLRSLLNNTVANPRGDLKAITTRSGVTCDGPTIPPTPSPLLKEVEREIKTIKDKVQPTSSESTAHVQPPKLSLSELTSTRMTLELLNQSVVIPTGVAKDVFVKVRKFYFLVDFVVVDYDVDPRVPLILGRPFLRTTRALIDVLGEELTLQVNDEAIAFKVGHTSRYSCINYDETVHQGSDFILEEIETFLRTLNELNNLDDDYYDTEGDILYLEKLLNEDPSPNLPSMKNEDLKRVNSKIHEVIKKEVIKLLDAELIYPISDSLWVSPIYCVLKKGGMTVIKNEDNELIPTRLVTGWRVCIDYRKLNDAIRKDHFMLPFMDQMLERLTGNEYYYFLDGFSEYFQIPIDPQDQEKTTFTCPYGTFAYRRMPFGFYNALGMFQRCMMAIFYDMIKETMEVFMDDFLIFEDSFSSCLSHLDKMLKGCEDTNLVLNWKKCHFMVKEGIVLGYKISKSEIKIDRAKFDVIAKLPHSTSVKAFNMLKKKLTEALVLVAPNWDLPFEIMYNTSDYAVDAVLGQRKTKHFQPIHYASKTMTDAQAHYTIIEKELLAVMLSRDCSDGFSYSKNFMSLFVIKKGAENLAANHLSRLENPHEGDLEKKEINEEFPLETLGMISFSGDSSTSCDRGTHLFNDKFAKVILKYGVTYRLSTVYHPQTRGQVKVSNRGMKCILERTIGENRASLKFVRIREDYHEYGLPIPDMMLNDVIKRLESYQMFLKYSIGQIPPKNSRVKGSQGKKTADTPVADVEVSEESDSEPARKRTASKSISLTEAAEEEAARQVHATYARIMTKSILEPARRRSLGSSKGTSRIPRVRDASTVISATSTEGIESEYSEEDQDGDEEVDWIDSDEDKEKKYDTNDDKIIDLEMTDDEEIDDEFVHDDEQVNDDEGEEMLKAKVEDSGKACEEYSQEVLGFSMRGNPTPSTEPIVSNSSPTLTPFGDSECLLGETDAFLAIDDELISPEIDDCYYVSEGDILLFQEFLSDDPSSPPLPPQEFKVVKPTNEKSSIDEPPVVELKDLPPHLEYAFLEGDDKLPVIIAKDLKDEEKTALIKVLKSHKQALVWKLSDIKGDPVICHVMIMLKCAKINKNQTISTQDQKPQRKAGSGSKFSLNNLTMNLNLSKFQSLGTILAHRSKPKPSKVKCQNSRD